MGSVLFFGVTNVKDRWLAPLLFPLPLYLFLRLRDVPVPPARRRAFAWVLAVAAVAALGGRLAQAWVGPSFGIHTRLSAPFTELARQIGAAGFAGGTIVADGILLGGNLRLAFPTARVLTPAQLPAPPHRGSRDGRCLVVWKSDGDSGMPPVLERWLAGIPGTDGLRNGAPGSVVAPRKHQADRPYRLTFLLSAAGAGCFT
jgi:hypothetical protein